MQRMLLTFMIATLALLAMHEPAHAADTFTGALPYETWLRSIQKSLTGPVAFSVALIGIVSSGATLILGGGQIGQFMRSIVFLVLVMSMLVGANNMMTRLFNGAVVAEGAPADLTVTPRRPQGQGGCGDLDTFLRERGTEEVA
ncbi:MAG: TrbC/VirB2 family protein [Succinivibrionaceae bacterium]|nr:TrbC/VirB2 family protein [Succinivibrionaceae bacterium]